MPNKSLQMSGSTDYACTRNAAPEDIARVMRSADYPDVKRINPVLSLAGIVIKGFGRGSKELGIPTANLDAEELRASLDLIPAGVYFGWASVGASEKVYKMVMSIGWNPYYNNVMKTVEPHLLHEFSEDFYGEELRLVICGYLRPEKNFPGLDALIKAIRDDIEMAKNALDGEAFESDAKADALKPALR